MAANIPMICAIHAGQWMPPVRQYSDERPVSWSALGT
jgi:hypothetical protein